MIGRLIIFLHRKDQDISSSLELRSQSPIRHAIWFLSMLQYGELCIRESSFIAQWLSPVLHVFRKEVEKYRRRYRFRIKSSRTPPYNPTVPQHLMPFEASCRLPIGCIGRQRYPPQSGYRTLSYSFYTSWLNYKKRKRHWQSFTHMYITSTLLN